VSEPSLRDQFTAHTGEVVVLDTNTSMVFLGALGEVDEFFVTLEDADVHDMKEGSTSKDAYIHEARRTGIKKNRHRVFVRVPAIISFSRLDDVVLY